MQYTNDKNQSTKPGTITGIFRDKDSAEQAYRTLINKGYSPDKITVLMSEETRNNILKTIKINQNLVL